MQNKAYIYTYDADGNEKFGGLDILQYSYDQAGRGTARPVTFIDIYVCPHKLQRQYIYR